MRFNWTNNPIQSAPFAQLDSGALASGRFQGAANKTHFCEGAPMQSHWVTRARSSALL